MQRYFYPGDKWLFFKIYTVPTSANEILVKKIYPLISKWIKEDVVLKWFYIRYADPNPHLRIRFELNSAIMVGKVLNEMRFQLNEELQNGKISNLQIDTYQRELERYGSQTIEKCEDFFYKDSESVVSLINKEYDEFELIILTINWINSLFISVGMSLQEIQLFISEISARFAFEFNLSIEQIRVINKALRDLRPRIIKILRFSDLASDWSQHDYAWIKNSKNRRLLPSLIHMHINRLFSVNQRLYECLIYHMFNKSFEGLIANMEENDN